MPKVKFTIGKFGSNLNNYERVCFLEMKIGRQVLDVGYYGRIRAARRAALRIANKLALDPMQYGITVE
jgi:hypothetical protein